MADESSAKNSIKKIVVGMTGREDSAVAAFLLKKQGYDVVGLSIVVTDSSITDNENSLPKCHILDLDRVKDLCSKLGVPHYATDAKGEYQYRVIDPLVENKLIARANSSCLNCTKMKVKVLYEKMKLLKADYISTGHYCKVQHNISTDEHFIHSNNDLDCDQSFLLAGLEQQYLKHLVLPLGELRKQEVSKIAKKFGLLSLESKSQVGFCFKTKEASEQLLTKLSPQSLVKEGQIIHEKTETVYGDHKGIIHHHITEKEFELSSGQKLDKHLEIVDYNYHSAAILVGEKSALTFRGVQITHLLMAEGIDKSRPLTCFMKFKYSDHFIKANLFFKNNQSAYLDFFEDVYPLICGEHIVLYNSNNRNAKLIGHAQIGSRGPFTIIDRVDLFRKAEAGQEDEESEDDKQQNTETVTMFRF